MKRVFVLRGVASTEAAKYARAYHPLNSPCDQTVVTRAKSHQVSFYIGTGQRCPFGSTATNRSDPAAPGSFCVYTATSFESKSKITQREFSSTQGHGEREGRRKLWIRRPANCDCVVYLSMLYSCDSWADSFFGGTDGAVRFWMVYNLLIAYPTFYRYVPRRSCQYSG